MKSHFEVLLEKAMDECATGSLALPLGDTLNHARLKGRHDGLKEAAMLYRKSIRADLEEDAA